MVERIEAMARFLWEGRTARRRFANLEGDLQPVDLGEAYAAQEAYHRLAEATYGPVAGVKIATTTKVMQKVMGIDHPCGGAIFARTIHTSPARIEKASFVNLCIESEIGLRLASDMPVGGAPWTAETVAPHVAGAMPAYELIEDRHAVYLETRAVSLIADNCWNGGVVLGPMRPVTRERLAGIRGRQKIDGKVVGEGAAEDPFATLAWLANVMAERGRGLTAGMVVITGSLVPTFPAQAGTHLAFEVDGLGEAVLDVG